MRGPLLNQPEGEDCLYVGPLEPAKYLARQERYVVEGEVLSSPNGLRCWRVALCDQPVMDEPDPDDKWIEPDSTAEWGSCLGVTEESQETAWRYALGAFFGPDDDGYDEPRLLDQLSKAAAFLDLIGSSGSVTEPPAVPVERAGQRPTPDEGYDLCFWHDQPHVREPDERNPDGCGWRTLHAFTPGKVEGE